MVPCARQLAIFGLGLCAATVAPAATYVYQGNPFTDIFPAFTDDRVASYDPAMALRLSFDISEPLPLTTDFQFLRNVVTAYSFSDGVQVLDQDNSVLDMLTLRLDAAGNIGEWQILAVDRGPSPAGLGGLARSIASSSAPDFTGRDLGTVARCAELTAEGTCAAAIVNSALTIGSPGVWRSETSTPTPIPLPPGMALLATGLLVLAACTQFLRRKGHITR